MPDSGGPEFDAMFVHEFPRVARVVHHIVGDRARAEELKAEGRPGAVRLVKLLDDPARYLNTALLMRLLCEISAIVLVATWARDAYQGSPVPTFLTTIGVMLVVSFVVIGVAPRTIGRQHDVRVALASAGPLSLVTTVLGPIPALLIPVSYTHLTLPTKNSPCRSRWSPYH